ncbi:hypothetical protein BC628DRAFT_1362696 [Trametes gibbosa]|nr:hypothetical protein BC628DRAFT_1362696 [Trametes gibbosa]
MTSRHPHSTSSVSLVPTPSPPPSCMLLAARAPLVVAVALNVLARSLAATTTALTVQTTVQCPLPVLSRAFSTVMSDTSTGPSPSSPEFIQDRLSTLLSSPHIHFNRPPQTGPLKIRMGPGPVDLFSTRFSNFFTHDASGVISGKEVDREGLKNALLALQKRWNPQEASFEAQRSSAKLLWTHMGQQAAVTVSAEVKEEGGAHRISHLILDGDDTLFSS